MNNYILEIENYDVKIPCIILTESLESGISPIEITIQLYESKPNFQEIDENLNKMLKWCSDVFCNEIVFETLIIKNSTKTWNLKEAYPIKINFGEMSYSSTIEYDLIFTIEFSEMIKG